ncbi:hypothetical protein S83_036078 [Arachis hypogaea]
MDLPSMLYSQLKAVEPFFLLADPNVIESEEHIMKMANHTNTITSRWRRCYKWRASRTNTLHCKNCSCCRSRWNFMEVHDDLLNAHVDRPTQWPLHHLEELLEELVAIVVSCFLKGEFFGVEWETISHL